MKSKGHNSFLKAAITLVLLCFAIVSLFPFFIMIIMSTYKNEALFRGLHFLPGNYFLENLKTVLKNDFFLYYKNSLIVSVCATIGTLFVSILAGFAFGKLRFKGKNLLFGIVLATMTIPAQVNLVGFLVEMKTLGWNNTFLPLIIPYWASAFGVYWMKQYIQSAVPTELLEAATMDGCSILQMILRIVVPISKPACITMILLFFLWNWNDYLTPLVILANQDLYTIQLSLNMIGMLHRTDYAARILYLALATMPILILFACGSKYLIKGMVAGSIKG